MNFRTIAVLALTAMLTVPALADDADNPKKKDKKSKAKKGLAAMLIKQLEPVGLTDEQTEKIKELGKATIKENKALMDDLTPELVKKYKEATKSLRETGVKGKDLPVAVNEKLGLTDEQIKSFKELSSSQMKLKEDIVALLTDEQKEKMPEKLQRLLNGKKAKEKGKKKDKDAA